MNVNNVTLEAVGVKPGQFPPEGLPETAFVGKSNVGKSSLINAMIGRKALARVSGAPGKTRTINFYNVEGILRFVDLPGYGYAKVSHSQSREWGAMIENYLKKRESLKCIVMLVDIRHEPSANDKMMYDWLRHYGYEMIIAATKLDKIKKSQRQKHTAAIRRGLGMEAGKQLVAFSSETKEGKDELWALIESRL